MVEIEATQQKRCSLVYTISSFYEAHQTFYICWYSFPLPILRTTKSVLTSQLVHQKIAPISQYWQPSDFLLIGFGRSRGCSCCGIQQSKQVTWCTPRKQRSWINKQNDFCDTPLHAPCQKINVHWTRFLLVCSTKIWMKIS